MKLTDLTESNWTWSLKTPGVMVQGVDEISQCVVIIVTTLKGSDPLRPEFGSDLPLYVDQPSNNVAKMINSISEALAIWETRIDVTKISFKIDVGSVDFEISWQEKTSGITATTNIKLNGSN
jgi:phage baseplate assembly protein W